MIQSEVRHACGRKQARNVFLFEAIGPKELRSHLYGSEDIVCIVSTRCGKPIVPSDSRKALLRACPLQEYEKGTERRATRVRPLVAVKENS